MIESYNSSLLSSLRTVLLLTLLLTLAACGASSLVVPAAAHSHSEPPPRPAVTWFECQPRVVCVAHDDAAAVFAYIEALDRYFALLTEEHSND